MPEHHSHTIIMLPDGEAMVDSIDIGQ